MIVSLVFLLGGVVTARALAHHLAKAPEGFEDASGFHFVARGSAVRIHRTSAQRHLISAVGSANGEQLHAATSTDARAATAVTA
jgi:hypothetical protein